MYCMLNIHLYIATMIMEILLLEDFLYVFDAG